MQNNLALKSNLEYMERQQQQQMQDNMKNHFAQMIDFNNSNKN